MTEQEINDLTIVSQIEEGFLANTLYNRLMGAEGSNLTVVDTDLPPYERIFMNEGLQKPTLAMFESELSEYKTELLTALAAAEQAELDRIAAEEARAARVIRIAPTISYFKEHVELAIAYKGEQQKNWLTYIEQELYPEMLEMSEAEVVALEESAEALRIELLAKEKERVELAAAAKTMQECQKALEYIISYNQVEYSLGNIDDDGLDALEVTFTDVLKALQGFRPKKAYGLVTTLDLSDTIYTEVARTSLLNILSGQ